MDHTISHLFLKRLEAIMLTYIVSPLAVVVSAAKGLTMYIDINTKTYDMQRLINKFYNRKIK